MFNVISKKIRIIDEKWLLCFVFLFAFLIRLALFLKQGVMLGGDSLWYIDKANKILSEGLGYYGQIASIAYWGYSSFLAIFFAIFGENYMIVVLVQILLSSFSVVLVYKIAEFIFNRRIISIVSGVIMAVLWECFRWDPFVLTDTLGLFLIVLCVYFYSLQNSLVGSKKTAAIIATVLSSALFFLSRPTALPFIAVLLLFAFVQLPAVYKKTSIFILIVFMAIAVLFLIKSVIYGNGYLARAFSYFLGLYESGILVTGMPEYDYNINQSNIGTPMFIKDIFMMILMKIYLFWKVIVVQHSMSHKLFNAIFLFPLFSLFFVGVFNLIKTKFMKSYFLISVISAYTLFHSLTEVDFDWRYRIAILPFVAIIASYGFIYIVDIILKKDGATSK